MVFNYLSFVDLFGDSGSFVVRAANGAFVEVSSRDRLLVPLGVCFVFSLQRPIAFGLGLAALMVGALPHFNTTDDILARERNFFGIWRVTANPKRVSAF